jgi:ketosteroid isomerase-like protein
MQRSAGTRVDMHAAGSNSRPSIGGASARHAGADVSFEEITRFASGALAYTVWIERAQAQTIGTAETSSIALRVTHTYRREDGDWKLVHRHADPLVSGLNATTIIQRQPN